MLWSILIPTLEDRKDMFFDLYEELIHQILEAKAYGLIDIRSCCDDGTQSIGYKRNFLKRLAIGKYVSYLDDDDMILPGYVKHIVRYLQSGKEVDCITFDAIMTHNGLHERCYNFGLEYDEYAFDKSGYYRPPGHLTPIRREIVEKYDFKEYKKENDKGSDVEWAMRMVEDMAIKTSMHIDEKLYHYKYREKGNGQTKRHIQP